MNNNFSNYICQEKVVIIFVITEVNMIKKKIAQIGNSWGIVIPKAILEGLGINPILDEVELYIENNEIRIRKVKKD